MEQRTLGNTGLSVTALGYGAMELRHLEEREAGRLLNAVLDGGINFIDTSPDYGPSEAYIGKAISHRRDEFYLATKCGCNVDRDGRGQDPSHIWSSEQLLKNIENSLQLLKTDYIDVWQLHGTLPEWLAGGRDDDVIKTMLELKQQGKVRSIGISYRNGGPGDPLYPAGYGFQCIQEYLQWGVFDIMQIVYGGLTRKSEMAIAKAAEKGVGIIVRGVLKRYQENYDELFDRAGLDELCEEGESRNGFLVRFAQSHPGLSTMIIGTKNPHHLAENIEAAQSGRLADEAYAKAKSRLDAVSIVADDIWEERSR
jgi:aryl-alcohol dehydrogenase-like predicted oxidoreductase